MLEGKGLKWIGGMVLMFQSKDDPEDMKKIIFAVVALEVLLFFFAVAIGMVG